MVKSITQFASVVIAGSVLALAPAAAQDILVQAHPTFRDFEYGSDGQELPTRAAASLRAMVPTGTTISAARAMIMAKGAHCGAAIGDGQTRCIFTGFSADNDHLRDIMWTVRLDSKAGQIVDIDVARESIGS